LHYLFIYLFIFPFDGVRQSPLARIRSELPFTGPEPACGISFGVAIKSGQGLDEQETYQTMGILNGTQTGKGTNTRTLCLKIERSVVVQ
jgi:hypothetical protein